ncbi:MAG: PIN domain-containing protein [archaeon]|nr:PIN domain-containing protein [archaeon]MCP8321467.1 PIN domain-containing protein [archaeon]
MKIVVDSYAWIEIFLGSEKGAKAKQIIGEAEEGRTPDIVLAEIARKYSREGVKEAEIRHRLRVIHATSIITSIDSEIAILAGKTYLESLERAQKEKLQNPGLFDAIVLATARAYNAKVITGDEHFRNLPETIFI